MEKFLLNTSKQQEINTLNSLFAEMVLDEAHRDFRIDQILKEIDRTLQYRNKEEFLRLTEELNSLKR
ncbi:MAG: IDEAL domain-containing protein [Bacillota bacterium]